MTDSRKDSRRKDSDFWVCPQCTRRHDLPRWSTDLQAADCEGCGFTTTIAQILATKKKQELTKLKKEDQIIQMLFDLQEAVSNLRGDVISMLRIVEALANR